MVDINEALMRRVKPSPPVKRRRVASSQKKASASASTGILRFSQPLEVLSLPTKKRETAPSPSRPTSPSRPVAKPSFESPMPSVPTKQAYIDLGQKGFGRHVTCRKCGLLYTVGEEEDEKEHRRFCRDHQRGIVVAKWKNERLLKAFPEDDARIIEIRRDDGPLHVKKLFEVKAVLDDALGFVDEDVFLKRGHFLFIQAKQVVGCMTVERISKAIVLETPYKPEASSDSKPRPESDPVAAELGICQLWVHPKFRGKQIATRLVNTVREKFIYGLHIAKPRVAFAQPTKNGLAFATAYIAPHPVLVYDAPLVASAVSVSSVKRSLLH